jgi:hypothetical protein
VIGKIQGASRERHRQGVDSYFDKTTVQYWLKMQGTPQAECRSVRLLQVSRCLLA